MTDRLHSSATLLEGMEGVQFGNGPTDRKRELQDKIKVTRLQNQWTYMDLTMHIKSYCVLYIYIFKI